MTNERFSTIAIVYVTASVQYREHLSGLSQCAKQWIIAALAFLFTIEATSSALGVTTSAQH